MPRRIRKIGPRGLKTPRRLTYVRQWREHRQLTLEQLGSRLDMSAAQLSRIETGKSPYTQDFLESAAEALRTDIASLLMRDPTDADAIWSIWEAARPGQRRAIVEHAKIIVKTST